jgi:hypothetical protein
MPFDPNLYSAPQSAPTNPQDVPPPEPLQKVIGDALGAAGNALEMPRRVTQGAAARVLSGIITGPTAPIQPPERIAQVEKLWAEGTRPEDIFHQLLATSWNGGEVPVTAGLSDIVYDPLVYWGAGLPGRVASAGAALNAPPNLVRAFQWLNTADQVTANLPWQGVKGTVKGVGKVLGAAPLPGAIKITTEGGAKVAARNLGTYLGSPSAQTLYKQKVRDLIDSVGTVIQRGHSFEQDLYESSILKDAMSQRTPSKITSALPMIAQEQGKLLDEVRQVKDPNARVQAMAVFEHTQQTVGDLLRQASANQYGGGKPKDALQFYDTARKAIVAGRVLVDRINQNPTNLLSVEGTAGPAVYNAYEAAINRIYPAFREAEQLRNLPGRPGGKVLGPPAPGQATPTNFEIAEQTQQKVQAAIDAFWGDVGSNPAVRPGVPVPTMTPNGPVLQLGNQNLPLQKAARDAILAPHADLMSMATAVQNGLPSLSAVLPQRLQDTGIQTFPEITHQYDQLMRDRSNIGKVLNEVWQKAMPGKPLPVQLPARWNTIENPDLMGTVVNPILTALGEQPINHVVELFNRPTVQKWLSARSVNGLKRSVSRWPEGDMLTDNPYKLTIDHIAREYQQQYGVKTEGLGATLRDATALWKEAQLGGNPGYLITNLMGILANGALEGISPVKVAADFFTNLGGSVFRNKSVLIPDLANVQAATGINIPHSIVSGAAILADANATKEFLGRGVTASARIGPLKLGLGGAALGAVAGGLQPEPYDVAGQKRVGDIAKGAATGAVVGLSFPALSEVLLRRIAAGMEAGARENAFLYRFTSGLAPRLDELNKLIDAAGYEVKAGVQNVKQQSVGLGQLAQGGNAAPVATTASRVATPAAPFANPVDLNSIKNFVASRGGYVHPDWLSENLQRAGVTAKTAHSVAEAWQTMLDGASKEGEAFAGRIHVDYEKLNNFEQFMAQMAPFSTWANKMTPFYAEHVLSKPSVLFSLLDYAHMSEQYRQERGLPSRFIGSVEDPQINGIVSAIFGRPIRLAWNPIRGFMPFADVGRLASAAPSEDNAFASAYKLLTSLGPTPHPLIELALRTGGAFGTGEPAPPLFSFGNRVLAATGVDLNLPGERGEQAIRRTISGRQPSDLDNFAIDRKVQEIAFRNLGHLPRSGDPASDPYMKARVDQAGPVWDQAKKEYRQEQALRAVFSLGGQTFSPQATLNPEEAAIRQAGKPIYQGGQKLAIDPARYPNLDDKLHNLLIQGKQTEAAPNEIAYPIRQLATEAFGPVDTWEQNFGAGGTMLKQYYDEGTVGSVDVLYNAVRSAQALARPEMQGFSGGLSPEEAQLSAMMESYSNPGSLVQNLSPEAQAALTKAWFTYQNSGPFRARLIQDKSASGYWLQQANNARDAFRSANPILDQYLNYLSAKPQGNMQDFLDHYYQKTVTGFGQ